MTFLEFKERLDYLLAGDTDMRHDDGAIKSLYARAVDTLLAAVEPLSLITADRQRFTSFRPLDDTYFIRRPAMPQADSDVLDLDTPLCEVALTLVASYITRANRSSQRVELEAKALRQIDAYMAQSFEQLQSMGFYDAGGGYTAHSRRDIPPRLDHAGFLKYYTPAKTVDGWDYQWDRDCVDHIDRFMLKGGPLSPSQIKLWEQFCAWQDSEESDDPETAALEALDRMYAESERS